MSETFLGMPVTAPRGVVHWAADANEANRIVTDLVRATGEQRVIKVKSMATQEIGLNEALEAAGITPVETDLADAVGRQALHCIRCSACLNTCPVYERTGGHAYGSVYPGPIGAVLSPQLTGVKENPSLPFASTLCGACYDVCPVAIDIPQMLVHLRSRVVEAKRGNRLPTPEQAVMASAAFAMESPARRTAALRAAPPGRLPGGRPPPIN